MNRVDKVFAELKSKGKKALIPFITGGDPDLEISLALMHGLASAGADIIEVGVPFSDPMADGPAIQLANERAIAAGNGLTQVMTLISQFRETNNHTPVILMGYANPLEFMGYQRFADRAAEVGVDGTIIVDLPPEEATYMSGLLAEKDIAPIYLLTPTTSNDRARKILEDCRGYVYYVSLKGVTGSNRINTAEVSAQVSRFRKMTDLPIAVGFGIRDSKTAAQVAETADGVVIGSVLVNRIGELADKPKDQIVAEIAGMIGQMRQAMDA